MNKKEKDPFAEKRLNSYGSHQKNLYNKVLYNKKELVDQAFRDNAVNDCFYLNLINHLQRLVFVLMSEHHHQYH